LFGIATPDKNVESAIGYPRGYLTFLRSPLHGIHARVDVESALGRAWNACSICRGISARPSVETALDLPWNTQPASSSRRPTTKSSVQ
jgi:hypothetical protein